MRHHRASDGPHIQTLGDLLYADSSGTISEADWVQLVELVATGDQHALQALYERSYRLVFTLGMRLCQNREIAEEITVDVFHDVWRRAGTYDPVNGTVLGWIMNQARSRSIDRLRHDQRKKRVAPDGVQHDEEHISPADAMAARQQREQLNEALSTLTIDERTAIETAFFSEKTYAETAAHLDEPLGTVKTRVRSALAKLRKALGTEESQP